MADRRLTWFPFYAAEWLLDERVRAMTPEARGVYVDLLCLQWREGSIPDNASTLARFLGLSVRRMAGIWDEVRPHFDPIGAEGRIANHTLAEIRSEQAAKYQRRSEAGAKGGYSKALAMLEQPQSNALALDREVDREVEKKRTTTRRFAPPDWVPADAWSGFLEMRRGKKAPNTHRALQGIVNDLEKLKTEGFDPTNVLDQSTKRAWTGVFPIRSDNVNGGQYAPAKPLPDYLTRNLAAPRPGDRASVPGRRDELVGAASRQPRHGENGGDREAGTPVRTDSSSDLAGDAGRS